MKNTGCDAVILGCTEIPLVVSDLNSPLPTLDPHAVGASSLAPGLGCACSGGHSLNDIVNILARCVDYPLKINHEARRSFDIPISVLKIDRARNELGWAPIVPFDEGVAQAILDVKSRL
jgi:UDP-glucose 4-epimerase